MKTLVGIVGFWLLYLIVGPWIASAIWSWTVSALFPGLVANNTIYVSAFAFSAANWLFGLKILLLSALLFGTSRFKLSS